MVTERGERQFESRSAMYISHRPQRRLGRWAAVELPRKFLRQRKRVQKRELRKYVVGMLMVDQGPAVVGFTGLEQVRESWMRRGQRFGGEHLTEQDRA